MLGSAASLLRAADMTRDIAGSVRMVDARLSIGQLESLGIPTGVALAEDDLNYALVALEELAQRAELLSVVVRFAATSYGLVEAVVEATTRRVAANVAAVLGFLFPAWAAALVFTTPALPMFAGIGIAAYLLTRNNSDLLNAKATAGPLNELLSDPAFVLALRHGVM